MKNDQSLEQDIAAVSSGDEAGTVPLRLVATQMCWPGA